MSRLPGLLALCVLVVVVASSHDAAAQVDATSIVRALRARGIAQVTPEFSASPGRMPLVVELPPGADARAHGLQPVGDGRFATWEASADEVEQLARARPDFRLWWAPPLRPLLDWATRWTRAGDFRNATGGTGQGAIIGIVDTGLDVTHPDLRYADGRTRVRWLLDFSQSPAGRHPELEEQYQCTGKVPCAIFDGADIDELLNNAVLGDVPEDSFGHGTHVASLAAGNGLGSPVPRYVGVAPEAQLVVARVTRTGGAEIFDNDILVATDFIFNRATLLGLPAVVNLSLGSDFGAHDGSSSLEQGLAGYVGPNAPGRSIVVAAGNSGGVFVGVSKDYPEPLGIHTEVHVPRSGNVRIPIVTPKTSKKQTHARVYIWIASRPSDELAVGFERKGNTFAEPQPPGESASFKDGEFSLTIVNEQSGPDSLIAQSAKSRSAVVVIDGTWESGETFALRFEGHGSAELWVQSEGDLGPESGSIGALFPAALKDGTIDVPASHPDLIAVGATLDRTEWTDFSGNLVEVKRHGSLTSPPPDTVTYFTGAGPTADGRLKPDIVAPGAFVVGAMSKLADPRNSAGGMFDGQGVCEPDRQCLVVDNRHAVASGTSMASPIAAGAIALLLEQRPSLTQPEIITLLQAGARKLEGIVLVEQQAGPHALDVVGSLAALELRDAPLLEERLPTALQSWLVLSSAYVRPDPDYPLIGLLQLRDAEAKIADGFSPDRLRLDPGFALVRKALHRVAPGLWSFELAAPPHTGSGQLELVVLFDGAPLMKRVVPVAVDQHVAEGGFSTRGGCAITTTTARMPLALAALILAVALVRPAYRERGRRSA